MQYENIAAINKTYQHVYIAPHLDDVAFSCSGLIAQQVKADEAILVVTVFTADVEPEHKPHDPALKNVVDTVRRRVEDQKAMDYLGVDYLWLEHKDWIFRHRHPLYRYSLSPGLLKGERELTDVIASQIKAVCRQAGNQCLYLPMGIGQHADHQLVFQCGVQMAQPELPDLQMVFYEEIPYALFPNLLDYRLMAVGQDAAQSQEPDLRKPQAIIPAGREFFRALREVPTLLGNNVWMRWLAYGVIWAFLVYVRFLMRPRRNCFNTRQLTPQQIDIGPGLEKKFRAIQCYPSQIEQIRDYPEKMEKMLRTYAQALSAGTKMFAERYWVLSE
jgi:LmbE family N-acetylglucosaminyl deacetylase